MVVLIVHDFGVLIVIEILFFVSVLALLDDLNVLACLFGFTHCLFALGCVLEGTSEDGIALLMHVSKNYQLDLK